MEPEERKGVEDAQTEAWEFGFATGQMAARERFEAWRDVSRRLVGVEAATSDAEGFDGEFAGRTLGSVTFVRSRSRLSWYERTRSLADDSDEISLSFVGGGHRVAQPAGDDIWVPEAGAVLLSHDRPFTLAQADDHDTSFHFVMDRRPVMELLPPGAPIGIRAVGNGPIVPLVRGYVRSLAAGTETLSGQEREMVGRHIIDLVAALLRPAPDAVEVVSNRGLKAARIKAILDLVARGFRRPDLSAEAIGARLGVSARQVHRLLEETPKTLYEHVLEARLKHAFDLLSDPLGAAMPVGDIARQCGFSRHSHFSRSFSTRFGETPTAIRAKAARDAAAASRPAAHRS